MQNALKSSKMHLEVWLVVYTKGNLDSHQRVALTGSRPYSTTFSFRLEQNVPLEVNNDKIKTSSLQGLRSSGPCDHNLR